LGVGGEFTELHARLKADTLLDFATDQRQKQSTKL
jgi:hypothetical protein